MPRYKSLTPKMMLQLAAPHTWAASVMPVLVASALALAATGSTMGTMTMLLGVICVLMQSSVNTFNDYFDFVKGADTADDNVEESDSVLVYNNVNPKAVLAYGIALLVVAFALGVIVILAAGFVPLVIAVIGAIVVVLYSGGKTPISYLPIGEAVSGIVMGGLIPLACFYVLTSGDLDLNVLIWAMPEIIGVGLIMMTNNACDIEKDEEVGRRTLPVRLGRERTRNLYGFLLLAMVFMICAVVILRFERGIFVLAFMVAAAFPILKQLLSNPLTQQSRVAAMGQIVSANIVLGAFYACALFV